MARRLNSKSPRAPRACRPRTSNPSNQGVIPVRRGHHFINESGRYAQASRPFLLRCLYSPFLCFGQKKFYCHSETMGGLRFGGVSRRKGWPFLRSSRSFFAASTIEGFLNKSIVVAASVFAATSMPFCPMDIPEQAVTCQLWMGAR